MFRQDFEAEGHYFAADAWLRLLKFYLGRDSEARFGQDFEV